VEEEDGATTVTELPVVVEEEKLPIPWQPTRQWQQPPGLATQTLAQFLDSGLSRLNGFST